MPAPITGASTLAHCKILPAHAGAHRVGVDVMAVRSPLAWWTRRIPLALALAVALGWLPYQLFGESGLSKLVQLRADLARVRADNVELRRKNRALRVELSLYDDDNLGSVERIARDELGLVKPGEIVFKVEVEVAP